MKIKLHLIPAFALLAVSAFAGAPKQADIVDTAASTPGFKTLVAAIKAAGLAETLKGEGPFTVFAPTDEAFEKLEKAKPGTLAMLLKPENKKKLVAILTYHVVSGKVLSTDVAKLKNGAHVKTVGGKSITIHNKHGVKIDNAKVIKADIQTSNGVIHVIDTVLIPK